MFTDPVGAPRQEVLLLVHNPWTGLNLRPRIRIGCAGKVVSVFDIARHLALGADWCNAARGVMFSLGCLQAMTCDTGACPTGVRTRDPQRQKALVVPDKIERVCRFHEQTLRALKELGQAAGLMHPADITASHIVRRRPEGAVRLLANELLFVKPGELLAAEQGLTAWPHRVFELYWPQARADRFTTCAALPAAIAPVHQTSDRATRA